MVSKDVIVVGAGPSGSRLAFKLAGLGYEVLVIDRKAAAGEDVCCTGIVSQQCLDYFNIDRSLALKEANSAKFVAPSGKWLRFWRDSQVAYVLDRSALDLTLADRARDVGADYTFATQVTAVEPEENSVLVKANCRGERVAFTARTVVLATGFGSPLPGKLGMGRISDVVIGVQARIEMGECDEIEVYFDRIVAPGGFAWLVPTADGRGLAGLLAIRHPELYLDNLLTRLREQGKITSAEAEVKHDAIPLRPLPRACADRILVIGEAAGQVKPTTGGGIYYGLLCADIAADTLHQSFMTNDFSAARLSSYDRHWRARLGRELKTSYFFLRFYRRLSNQQIERLFRIMSRNNIPDFIADLETLPFDWHSTIIFKLLRHLTANGALWATRSLLAPIRTRGKSHEEGKD